MSFQVDFLAMEDLGLPVLHTEIPDGLPSGTLCIYRVPADDTLEMFTYEIFYNLTNMEQRPMCGSEQFTLLAKYTVYDGLHTYETVYEHPSVQSTVIPATLVEE